MEENLVVKLPRITQAQQHDTTPQQSTSGHECTKHSSTERVRKYRERIRDDPALLEAQKEKKREQNRVYKAKLKAQRLESEAVNKKMKEHQREYQRKRRQSKKLDKKLKLTKSAVSKRKAYHPVKVSSERTLSCSDSASDTSEPSKE